MPYTWSRTTPRHFEPGLRADVEADLIGDYVHRQVEPHRVLEGPSPAPADHLDSLLYTDRISDD